jgi:hypothetical protein
VVLNIKSCLIRNAPAAGFRNFTTEDTGGTEKEPLRSLCPLW